MQKFEIQLSVDQKKQLSKEFKKSYQAVTMSLKYVFNSDTARSIRRRAKEMLQQEIEKINVNP